MSKEKYFNSSGLLIRSLPFLMGNSKSRKEWRKIVDEVAGFYPPKSEKGGSTPFYGKHEAFKRAVYQIGLHCSSGNNVRRLKKMALTESKPSPRRADIQQALEDAQDTIENLFYHVYLLFNDSANPISRMERRRGKAQLAYAMKHDVPPEYLTGFIAQSGGDSTVFSKLNADKRESWYKWRQKMDQH